MENQSQSVFHNGGIANQMHFQSNTKHQFNLNAFNACCIHVHKAKYSMNVQCLALGILEIVWAQIISFETWKDIT
jgi:hypothetical protein